MHPHGSTGLFDSLVSLALDKLRFTSTAVIAHGSPEKTMVCGEPVWWGNFAFPTQTTVFSQILMPCNIICTLIFTSFNVSGIFQDILAISI